MSFKRLGRDVDIFEPREPLRGERPRFETEEQARRFVDDLDYDLPQSPMPMRTPSRRRLVPYGGAVSLVVSGASLPPSGRPPAQK